MPLDPDPIDWEPYREQLQCMNEREREVLKWAGQGFNAKEIAKRVGTTHYMVNKAIFAGRQRLGGHWSKAEAGRMVIAFEKAMGGSQEVQSLYPQKLDLSPTDSFEPDEPADVQADAPIPTGETLAADQDIASLLRHLALRDIVALRKSGRQDNDLKLFLTMVAIAAVTALALILAGSAASLLSALNSAYM